MTRLPTVGEGRSARQPALHVADMADTTITRSNPSPASRSALLGEWAPPST